MTEEKETRPVEETASQMDSWINNLIETGEMKEINPGVVREVLKSHGAEFNISPEAKKSLSEYTNKARAEGMRGVWGERFKIYKTWTKEYIREYEENPNNKLLPALKKSGRKNSGMIQFFGQLTSFASEQLDYEDFKRYTEARIHNGRCYAEGRKQDRVRVTVPTSVQPILLSSIPPDFPKAAYKKISEWKTD